MYVRTQPRRRADAQRNQDAIVEAALQVMSRLPDAGLAEVAAAAGLTRATLYAHFSSREELLAAVVRRTMHLTMTLVDEAQPDQGSPTNALRRVLRASWTILGEYRGLLTVARRTLGSEVLHAHHVPLERRLRSLILWGQHDGIFRMDLPVDWLLHVYFELVHAGHEYTQRQDADQKAVEPLLWATISAAFGVTDDPARI